jgi:replicative DNA helicase
VTVIRPEPEDSQLRVPPHSIEAEQSVLGGLLLDNDAWDKVGDILIPDNFYRYEHRMIYEAIGALVNANKPADIITVHDRLKVAGKAGDCGGMPYLNDLASSVISAQSIRGYAAIIMEKWQRRQIVAASDAAATRAFNSVEPAAEQLAQLGTELARMERGQAREVPELLDTIVVRMLDHVNDVHNGSALPGWTTGFKKLDSLMLLQPGRVYMLGGRPGMGKSALALQWASSLAIDHGLTTLYLSQEMGKLEVSQRAAARVGQVSYTRLQRGNMQDAEWGRLSEAVERMAKAAMSIDAQVGLAAGDIRIKARYVKGLNLLVLDYVQLCRGAEDGEKAETRNRELAALSEAVKVMASKLHIAVVALSALGRAVDERKNERPILSDLRDCGALEADADAVLSLWPIGKVIDRKGDNGARLMCLEILKQRNGPLGCVILNFWSDLMTFEETEYELDELLKKTKPVNRGGDL